MAIIELFNNAIMSIADFDFNTGVFSTFELTITLGFMLFFACILVKTVYSSYYSKPMNKKHMVDKSDSVLRGSAIAIEDVTLIGLTGRQRSGKDTIGKHLINDHGFIRVAFADILKEACKIIFGFSDEQVYGDDLKEVEDEYWKHTPREILQRVGSELFRDKLSEVCENISTDVWIRAVERKILNLIKKGHTKFVITDVRYQNELDFVKACNGISWKVTRPSLVNHGSADHQSEKSVDKFYCDCHFTNDSTIESLYETLEPEITKIKNRYSANSEQNDNHHINNSENKGMAVAI